MQTPPRPQTINRTLLINIKWEDALVEDYNYELRGIKK
jgi:hypothetical protein